MSFAKCAYHLLGLPFCSSPHLLCSLSTQEIVVWLIFFIFHVKGFIQLLLMTSDKYFSDPSGGIMVTENFFWNTVTFFLKFLTTIIIPTKQICSERLKVSPCCHSFWHRCPRRRAWSWGILSVREHSTNDCCWYEAIFKSKPAIHTAGKLCQHDAHDTCACELYFQQSVTRPPLWSMPKQLRASPADMPLRSWYTACTNHFRLTDFCQAKIINTTGLSNKPSTA